MRTKEELLFDLQLLDKFVGVSFPDSNLEFYFAGGSACVLAGYMDRATLDFDFVDRGYSSKFSKVLKMLEPYDLLSAYSAAIPLNYMNRAIKLDGYENISVYLFSREDIIASKIDRLAQKDIEDINILIRGADIDILEKCIVETYNNIVYDNRKLRYSRNLNKFRKIFNLPERK